MVTVKVLHDIGTVQVPLPAKNVRLAALPTLSAQLSALADPMLADVRVPLVGVGACGEGEAAGWTLTVLCFFSTIVWFDDAAAKLSIAIEMPVMLKNPPSKLRVLMKPNLEEDFFFMLQFPLFFQKEGSPDR
jgi:hypothetical protein